MLFINMVCLTVGLAYFHSVLSRAKQQRCLPRGGHRIPKVSCKPTMPYPSLPYEAATLETAVLPFQGWPARKRVQPAAVFYPFGHPTPYAYTTLKD
jgi:hypothetical protein